MFTIRKILPISIASCAVAAIATLGMVVPAHAAEAPWVLEDGVLTIGPGEIPETTEDYYGYDWWPAWAPNQATKDSITRVVFTHPTQTVLPANSSYLFDDHINVTEYVNIGQLNTTQVTKLTSFFDNNYSLLGLDLRDWETSNVTEMDDLFEDTHALQTINLTGWHTGKVKNMEDMFERSAVPLITGIEHWNTDSVTDMNEMFHGGSITSLNLSSWDTSSVDDMSEMFHDATALTELDLSSWDTSSLEDMELMFDGMISLRTLNLDGWDTTKSDTDNLLSNSGQLRHLVLGPLTELPSDVGLEDLLDTADADGDWTGNWIEIVPGTAAAPQGTGWAGGTSEDLEDLTQNQPGFTGGTFIAEQRYNISFSSNTPAGRTPSTATAPTALSGVTGVATSVPENPFGYSGFRFIGWNTAADGTGTMFQPGNTYPTAGTNTLYASWEAIAAPETIANTGNATPHTLIAASGAAILAGGILLARRFRITRPGQ